MAKITSHIVFETPRSIQEAASKTAVWEPAVSEMIEETPAAVLPEQMEYEPSDNEDSEPILEGEAHGQGSLAFNEGIVARSSGRA